MLADPEVQAVADRAQRAAGGRDRISRRAGQRARLPQCDAGRAARRGSATAPMAGRSRATSPIPNCGPSAITARPGSIICASATARPSPNARCISRRSTSTSGPIRCASAACWSGRSARCAGRKRRRTAPASRECCRWSRAGAGGSSMHVARAAFTARGRSAPCRRPCSAGRGSASGRRARPIAIVHTGAAEARDIARAGVVAGLLLRRGAGGAQNQRNNEKKSGHRVMPRTRKMSTAKSRAHDPAAATALLTRRWRNAAGPGLHARRSHGATDATTRSISLLDVWRQRPCVSALGGEILVHHRAAAGAQLGAMLIMQAVIFGMFGISELQRRKASPVHICCASA